MSDEFTEILKQVRQKRPLIHCITNYVTVNDCANILLACGASPIMADEKEEMEEITSLCGGLLLNIGTLNSRIVESMLLAGKKANLLSHPVVFDPVGAGASRLRIKTSLSLLEKLDISVLRGNISEIKALCSETGKPQGVDASLDDAVSENNLEASAMLVRDLSRKTKTIVAATGAIDLVSDGKRTYVIHGGHPEMEKVTGTGCMLSALCTAFVTANPKEPLRATAAAVCAMGLCGERAYRKVCDQKEGTASFRNRLIDEISLLNAKTLNEGAKFEIR